MLGALHSTRIFFCFTPKGYLFAQDTTISVRSRGMKPKYALLNFDRDNILVFYFFNLFLGCYSFRSAYVLFLVDYAISTNHK
jgi:hypothetical protein